MPKKKITGAPSMSRERMILKEDTRDVRKTHTLGDSRAAKAWSSGWRGRPGDRMEAFWKPNRRK